MSVPVIVTKRTIDLVLDIAATVTPRYITAMQPYNPLTVKKKNLLSIYISKLLNYYWKWSVNSWHNWRTSSSLQTKTKVQTLFSFSLYMDEEAAKTFWKQIKRQEWYSHFWIRQSGLKIFRLEIDAYLLKVCPCVCSY